MIRLFDKNSLVDGRSIGNEQDTVKEKNKAKGQETKVVWGKEEADYKIRTNYPLYSKTPFKRGNDHQKPRNPDLGHYRTT